MIAESQPSLSPMRARAYVALAAVLWSTSGAFTKILTRETILDLHDPAVAPLSIAFFRTLFGACAMATAIRWKDIRFRRLLPFMMLSFAVMNATFVSAMAIGTAANAILLQYTAPMWMYLASVYLLGEPPDTRSFRALVVGLVGIACILVGGWHEAQLFVVVIALVSGITYAAVVVCLRALRDLSSPWLNFLNQSFAALVLLPLVWFELFPTPGQLAILVIYGTLQLGLPYWLMARAVRSISAQEAGTICLLEPLLNPVWAYLISGEIPSPFSLVGGGFILGALLWRYWPTKRA